jgi:hypothetical protein
LWTNETPVWQVQKNLHKQRSFGKAQRGVLGCNSTSILNRRDEIFMIRTFLFFCASLGNTTKAKRPNENK